MKKLKANIPIYIDDGLVPYAGKSFFIHFFLAILIIFVPRIFDFETDSPKITKVVSAIRVDVVAMPKYTLSELKKLSASSRRQAKPKAAIENKGTEFLKKGKQKSLSDLLKNEASKEISIKETKERGKKRSGEKQAKLKKGLNGLILQGNKVSKGWAIVGDTREMVLDEFGKYVAGLPDIVRPHWKLPASLMKKDLNCRVQIFIGAKGELKKVKLFSSSGNSDYDKRAVEAVRESAFPAPSIEIKDKAKKGQILLGFPL